MLIVLVGDTTLLQPTLLVTQRAWKNLEKQRLYYSGNVQYVIEKSMTVPQAQFLAEGLGDFFKTLGKKWLGIRDDG